MPSKIEPSKVIILGRQLNCLVCGSEDFIHRRISLNSPLRVLMKLDWLKDASDVVVCDRCGHVHTFIV